MRTPLWRWVLGVVLGGVLLGGAIAPLGAQEPVLEGSFIFGSRNLTCESPNDPGTFYDVVYHVGGDPLGIAYPSDTIQLAAGAFYPDPDRTWGYDILYRDAGGLFVSDPSLVIAPNGDRAGFGIFGPLDDSPNNRARLGDACPEEVYDSFIGCKDFLQTCDELVVGNRVEPCEVAINPEGAIFRVDVPNGFYRFVAAVGDSDNPHAHRVLVENGGEGPPSEIGDHVVIVNNFDQAQYTIGNTGDARTGEGVFAAVGFDDKVPPLGDGVAPDPQFVSMDEDGYATSCPANSPVLEVTEGYIRLHALQGNSNIGPGGNNGRDPNGGDMVLLELWRFDSDPSIPSTPRLARSFEPATYTPGDTITVTLTVEGLTAASTLEETVPAGFTVLNAGGGQEADGTITFSLATDGILTYTVRSGGVCGDNLFNVALSIPGGSCQPTLASTPNCEPGLCGLQSSGGVSNFLILGPIDLGRLAGTNCADTYDGQTFVDRDYITDGVQTEADIIVALDDEVEPEFGGAAAGVGVGGSDAANVPGAPAPNPLINPFYAEGVLTVWAATADADGYVNFNNAENIGDPLNHYIVYSFVYLENTTPDCVETVLEVGADDAYKVRLNGQLIATDVACGGIAGYGAGDMIPVILPPGVNIVMIAVVESGGGTGVRLVIRDPDLNPLVDGSVVTTCEPPSEYIVPPPLEVTRSLDVGVTTIPENPVISVTLTATSVEGPTTIVDTFPAELEVVNAGSGTVAGNTIRFNVSADGDLTYLVKVAGNPDECPFINVRFRGIAALQGECGTAIRGQAGLGCQTICSATEESENAELVWAFIFGMRDLQCAVPNAPGDVYTTVFHVNNDPLGLAYPSEDIQLAAGAVYPNPDRMWGYEILYNDPAALFVTDPFLTASPYGDRLGFGIFGPFDESSNNRNEFANTCPDEIYDSFIGFKTFATACNAGTQGGPKVACDPPEGGVFRVDVPNGVYRFVLASGSAENTHGARILAENGGAGPVEAISENHVVLVHNFNPVDYDFGTTDGDLGDGIFAAVGFGDKVPPPGPGVAPSPQFVFMDENGMDTSGCPSSPTLEVTEGYIRFHTLQANANDGPGGAADANGGNLVLLEIWKVDETVQPGTKLRRGDANADGQLNITDGIFVLNYLFLGGNTPPCLESADANDDAQHNITDGIFILNFLFLGGAEPPPPGPNTCGVDPESNPANTFTCETYDPGLCQ